MSTKQSSVIHWSGVSDGSKFEFCRTPETSGVRPRFTDDRSKVTCPRCIFRLKRVDAGLPATLEKQVPIAVIRRERVRQAMKNAGLIDV